MKRKGIGALMLGAAMLLTAALASFAGCAEKEEEPPVPPGPGGDDPTDGAQLSLVEENDALTMSNGKISVTIAKQNGSLIRVSYPEKQAELVHGDANFSLTVDPTTDDVFKANHKGTSTILLQSKNFSPSVTTELTAEQATVELEYALSYRYEDAEVTGLRVKNTIALGKNDSFFTSDYEVVNGAPSGVVVTLTGAQLSGIRDESGMPWSLYYPDREGKLVDRAVAGGTKIKAAYPSPMSVQLLQVYNGDVSFDLSVLDTEGVYKEFCFGKFNGTLDYDAGGSDASMACTQFPYVKAGDRAEVSTYRIGAGGEGSWYEGADRYREFLISSGMTKPRNELTSEWAGMLSANTQGNSGIVVASYIGQGANPRSYLDIIDQVDGTGIDTFCAIGWHEGGFDHMYPDYEFSATQGGAEQFEQMTAEFKAKGKHIICYLNAHIADVNSKWSNETSKIDPSLSKIQAAATKTIGFEYGVTAPQDYDNYTYYERYVGLESQAISPASEEFYEAIVSATERLAAKGVDGIWFDQLMEMSCYLDYDSSHGAKNPATAYSEGFKKLLTKVCEIMDEATDGKSLFLCEGVCDAYIRYIDICGMMWQRLLGSSDTGQWNSDSIAWAPQVTRYTIPAPMLGMPSADAGSGSGLEFGRAFVLADPLLTSLDVPETHGGIRSVLNIYRLAPEIYYHGRFMDTRGLRIGSSDVLASLIVGSDGSIGLQLFNNSNKPIESLKVIFDPAALGLNGAAVSVTDLKTGEKIALRAANTIAVKLNAYSLNAYKIVIE